MTAILAQGQGLIGIGLILLLAWGLSEDRGARPSWKWIGSALLLQLAIAVTVINVPAIWAAVGIANDGVSAIERATLVGSSYMFGFIGGAPLPFELRPGAAAPVVIAFQILPLIIVFSALSALLWHWGILRAIVRGLSWAMRKSMGVSGVVGLGAGTAIFLGVVESPLVLRAWFDRMSRADLFANMVLTMATISGAILILYASTLSAVLPNAVSHMIVASLIALPAAVLIARIMVPGTGATDTAEVVADLAYESSIDALVRGTMEGVQLMFAVIGIIIVVFALVNLVDQALALLPLVDGDPLTLRRGFGWVFAPLMWSIGIPWDQSPAAGALMGTKTILNEYVAYLDMAALPPETFDPRSKLIMTYALCGVANLASVGLIVSTIGTLAPTRRTEVAALGMKSWIAGNFASAMTGAVIGIVTLA